MQKWFAVCALVICLWVRGVVKAEGLDEPWSVDERCPVLAGKDLHGKGKPGREAPAEMGGFFAYTWLRVYQDYFSVVMTSHCPLYPSCSNYSIQAVRRYGAFRGMTLTADRLIHEWTEALEAPVINVGGRVSCYDPVP